MLSAQDKYWVVWAERAIDLRGRSRNNTRGSDGKGESRRASGPRREGGAL